MSIYVCKCMDEGCHNYISTYDYEKLKFSRTEEQERYSCFVSIEGHYDNTSLVLAKSGDLVLRRYKTEDEITNDLPILS